MYACVHAGGIKLENERAYHTSITGLLLVRSPAGAWGTVCDDRMTHVEARAACASLGYSGGAVIFPSTNYRSIGTDALPTHLDDVDCSALSPASHFTECTSRGWGIHDCSKPEDVAIQCTILGEYLLFQCALTR